MKFTRFLIALLFLSTFCEPLEKAAGQTPRRPISRQARIDFPEGVPTIELPFESDGGLIVLPVHLGDSGPLRFVLDTGASNPLLTNPEIAEFESLRIVGRARVMGAGEGQPISIPLAADVDLRIGDLRVFVPFLAIMDSNAERRLRIWDGVIGRNIFEHAVVEIDWLASKVRFHDPAQYSYRGSGVALPIELRDGFCFLSNIGVRIGEVSKVIDLVVDTGHSEALAMHFDSQAGLSLPAKTLDGYLGRGMGGDINGKIGRVDEMTIGPFVFNEIVATFPNQAAGRVIFADGQGNLGSEILEKFRTIFDYSNRRLILESHDLLSLPFEYTMSGISFEPETYGREELVIYHMIADSPATDAGLRKGDRVIAIEGRFSRPSIATKLKQFSNRDPVDPFA